MLVGLDDVREITLTVKHQNVKGKTYYLHEGKTKTGKPKYYFSQNDEDAINTGIPDGYEIYEHPVSAQVFLRKIPKKIIQDNEVQIVEEGIRKYSQLTEFKIDIKKNSIIVYTPDENVSALTNILGGFFGSVSQGNDVIKKVLNYSPSMRFTLDNEEKRVFIAERYCYRGSIDDWFMLSETGKLNTLVKKYVQHLGKDSFYELY